MRTTRRVQAVLQTNDLITHLVSIQIVGLTLDQRSTRCRSRSHAITRHDRGARARTIPRRQDRRDVIRINASMHGLKRVIYVKISTFNTPTHANLGSRSTR